MSTPRILGIDPSTEGGTAVLLTAGECREFQRYPLLCGCLPDGLDLAVVETPDPRRGVYFNKGDGRPIRSQSSGVMRTAMMAVELRERARLVSPVLAVDPNVIRRQIAGYNGFRDGKADPFIKAWFQRQGFPCKLRGVLGNNHGRDAALAALFGLAWLEAGARGPALFTQATYYAAVSAKESV